MMFAYEKSFEEHYRCWLRKFGNKELMRVEKNLSAFIDCDLFDSFILADEVLTLYEIVRDECVYRIDELVSLIDLPCVPQQPVGVESA